MANTKKKVPKYKEALTLKEFDMNNIKDDSVCVFIGKRNTGKSFCVRDLMYHKRDFPAGKVISATEEANKFYGEFAPPAIISYDYEDRILDKFFMRQQILKEKKMSDPNFKYVDSRGFLVLDDLMFNDDWIKYRTTKKIFMNGRHYDILFIITMQYPLGIPPTLRSNIDYVFLFRDNIDANRKRLYENYAGMFPSFNCLCETLDKYTEDYGCIVICNNTQSNELSDQIFKYKAQKAPEFKICDPILWNIQKPKIAVNKSAGMFNVY
jgi:hypothetical protein